jgi:mannitol/fructose-specific phosphotransferase system IIA component (Ntr-type)
MSGLADLLATDRIVVDSLATSRREVLGALAALLGGNDAAVREAVRDDLSARERVSSTGVGGGIAFPHARVDSMPGIRLAFLRTVDTVEFGALDGRPVDLFLAVAGPKSARREYLSVLSRMSYAFRTDTVREEFRTAESPAEILALFSRYMSPSAGTA